MTYVNLDPDYFDHPKTLQIEALLGQGGAELPLRLWCYCAKYSPKGGDLGKRSVAEVEALLRWRGDPGMAVRALVRVGFLARKARAYVIHDWREHQGHIWALKIRNKKAARTRWGKLVDKLIHKGAVVENTEVPDDSVTTAPVRSFPYPSVEQRTGSLDQKDSNDVKALIASASDKRAHALREVKLLSMPMPYGRYQNVPVSDLPIEYVERISDKLDGPGIGKDLRDAIALRLKVRAEEMAK